MNRIERMNKRLEYLEQAVALLTAGKNFQPLVDQMENAQKAHDDNLSKSIDGARIGAMPRYAPPTKEERVYSPEMKLFAQVAKLEELARSDGKALDEHLKRLNKLDTQIHDLRRQIDLMSEQIYLHPTATDQRMVGATDTMMKLPRDPHELTRGLRRFSVWAEHPMGLDYLCKGIGVLFPNGHVILGNDDYLKIFPSEEAMATEYCGQGGRVHVQYLDSSA